MSPTVGRPRALQGRDRVLERHARDGVRRRARVRVDGPAELRGDLGPDGARRAALDPRRPPGSLLDCWTVGLLDCWTVGPCSWCWCWTVGPCSWCWCWTVGLLVTVTVTVSVSGRCVVSRDRSIPRPGRQPTVVHTTTAMGGESLLQHAVRKFSSGRVDTLLNTRCRFGLMEVGRERRCWSCWSRPFESFFSPCSVERRMMARVTPKTSSPPARAGAGPLRAHGALDRDDE